MLDSETGRALRDQEQELSTAFVEKYGEQLRLHLESQVFAAVCLCAASRVLRTPQSSDAFLAYRGDWMERS